MADTGFVICGTGANDASYGNKAWTNETNVQTDDTNNALVNVRSSQTPSNYLKATNYNHNLPAGAAVDGIETQYRRYKNSGDNVAEDRLRIVDELGAVGSDDKADGLNNWSTSAETLQDGGSTDLWLDTWNDTDVEDVDFGWVLAIQHVSGAGSHIANVEAMWTKIYYTAGGGAPVSMLWDNLRRKHND